MNATPPTYSGFHQIPRRNRAMRSRGFETLCFVVSTICIVLLATILLTIALQGLRVIRPAFFVNPPSPSPSEAGIGPALAGSFWVCLVCSLVTVPLGVATGILLEEFQPHSLWGRRLHGFLQLNIANLAGVPSIVYGLVGLTLFGSMLGLFGASHDPAIEFGVRYFYQYVTDADQVVFVRVSTPETPPSLTSETRFEDAEGNAVPVTLLEAADQAEQADAAAYALRRDARGGLIKRHRWYYLCLPFGRSVLAASLTLMLVILPLVIVSSQQALREVPASWRDVSAGLGATTWQTVRHVVLPEAMPNIISGALAALSRAVGEAAPILMLAGIVYITQAPRHLMDECSVLPIQVFYWATLPVDRTASINFQHVAAGGIIVLLTILLTMNGIASWIRGRANAR